MKKWRLGWLALLLCAGLSLPAAGQARGQGKGAASRQASEAQEERQAAQGNLFGRKLEKIIRDFFRDQKNLEGLPPGLARRDELPPGLRKQIRRNGELPPGLEKRLHPLPENLEILLPRLPEGRRRVILGSDVILLDERSNLILDVLEGVLAGIELVR